MTEFDCPEVILYGWQDVKSQLLTNVFLPFLFFFFFKKCIKVVYWSDINTGVKKKNEKERTNKKADISVFFVL